MESEDGGLEGWGEGGWRPVVGVLGDTFTPNFEGFFDVGGGGGESLDCGFVG